MSAKIKFSKNLIVQAAFDIASEEGIENVTIRRVAKEIGSSIAPIYVNFESVDELKKAVMTKSYEIYSSIVSSCEEPDDFLRFAYASITFSKTYPKLYDSLLLSQDDYMASKLNMERMITVLQNKHSDLNLSNESLQMAVMSMQALQVGLSIMARKSFFKPLLEEDKIISILDGIGMSLLEYLKNNNQ